MRITKLLIANRGEIAVRIARAAADLGIRTVAVHPADDAEALHTKIADEAHLLRGTGVAAYLDMQQLLQVAQAAGCDAVHPGYGFLSENQAFAELCEANGITFVGPTSTVLGLLGDKGRARQLAQECAVPLIAGTSGPTTLEQAKAFYDGLGPNAAVVVKAIAGGGGRGMRIVRRREDLDEAFARCRDEAQAAFGNGDLYVEQLVNRARHIEVQVIGDGSGNVCHLWERECSLQRRNQKLVEIAPSPSLSSALRDKIIDAALRIAGTVKYRSLGTFEFLVDIETESFAFIEANPRLQVEHTVTEEVTCVDLVQTQLRLAAGENLAALGLSQDSIPAPQGYAIQLRVNMETLDGQGNILPAGGTLNIFEPPTGPGVRVDTFGYGGYRISPHYDSLLAKLIVHSRGPGFAEAVQRAYRALCQFRVEGVQTNIGFLQNLLRRPELEDNSVYTRFVDEHMQALAGSADAAHPKMFFSAASRATADAAARVVTGPAGTTAVNSHMPGTVVAILVADGETVRAGQDLLVVEAMKMQHVVTAKTGGIVRQVAVEIGATVYDGDPLLFIEEAAVEGAEVMTEESVDLDAIRPDLAEALARHAIGLDENRPDAVAKRRKTGQRTARENVEDLCDPGSFIEYGALTFAAQRRRRSVEDLIRSTPADGLVGGIGTVNGSLFGEEQARCMVLAYDYTVLAGTQGTMNHKKTDRLFEVAEQLRLPSVFFTEGGGGRPGDTDNATKVAGLDVPSFIQYARLNGLAPRISIVSGRCFAGNAVFAGCSDILIATANANLGMAGPAMIEGGGLGVYAPEEVGPMSVQVPNGVVDYLAADEAEATAAAKRFLSYFQGRLPNWECKDQRLLRRCIPENRLRAYDVRTVIETLADTGSVMELRQKFAPGMITAFIRIEGQPIGLIANNPQHLGGAIDADGADKASRFMQLCDAFDIPILSLCDTPGFMVGPEAEKTALVRHTSRMFITAASLSVPMFTIVLRKGYGLGAMGMTGGSFHSTAFTASWPTGEFGGMGLEGAVRLAYRKELDAVEDPAGKQALFEKLVAESYERGKAISMAVSLEIDAVIDPADSRKWILRGLRSMPPRTQRDGKKRSMIDTW